MDIGALFLPVAIGLASLFAVTLFTVTLITHQPPARAKRSGKRD